MRSFILLLAGIGTAVAGLMLLESARKKPVDELAHRLEAAWADHHTVA